MLLQLNFSSDLPIYQQIRNQIVVGIASGELRPGDRMPTIRALAEESGINMTFSCLLGWLLTILMNRLRNKSVIPTLFSLLFLGAYFYLYANMNNYLGMLLANGQSIGDSLRTAVYPAWAFGTALAEGNMLSLLGFAGCSALPFAVIYIVLARSFLRLATGGRGFAKVKYREKPLRTASAAAALLKKELVHFGSNGMPLSAGNREISRVFTAAGFSAV